MSVIPNEDLQEAFLGASRGASARDASFLGGETIGSLVDRVGAALQRLLADESWHTILLGARGCTNRAILSSAVAGPGTFFGRLEQSPASISMVDYCREPVVRAVNMTPTIRSPRTAQHDARGHAHAVPVLPRLS